MTPGDPATATARRLIAMQGRDGLWGAFRLHPGESREWVGAVAAFALAQAAASGRLPPGLTRAARAAADRAADALVAAERPGWGYGASVPPDSDSTAAVLRLLTALSRQAQHSAAFLATQGDPVRGWATFGPMRSWDRWSMPCPEVDAASALALHGARALTRAGLVQVWRQRLAPLQGPDGHWRAYWWPGPGTATLAAIEVWQAAGRPAPQPLMPGPAGPAMAALDAVTLAQARAILDPAQGAASMRDACARMTRPGRWAADAVLLAPPRHPASPPGDASPEGMGVMTAAAALRALVATRPVRSTPPRAVPPRLPADLGDLALALGLSHRAAMLARRTVGALTGPLLGAPVPWPNRAVSSLARGWPVELSATMDGNDRPALRLACDLGDPCLPPAGRARVARASLVRAAEVLGLDGAPFLAGLGPVLPLARSAGPGHRFLIWGGLDLTDGPQGPQPVLKAYANLALAGPDPDARLDLAGRIMALAGGCDVTGGLRRLNAALDAGLPQQMALAVTAQGLAGAKVYWELPQHDGAATARLAAALGLALPAAFGPEIPGIASHAAALRGLSGLAVHVDPRCGIRPELTLATQAERSVAWQDAHEAACLTHWAAGMGLSAQPAVTLMAALRAHGQAPRSLHTLTLRPDHRLRAAVYLHADGWLARALSRSPAPHGPMPGPDPRPGHQPITETCHDP